MEVNYRPIGERVKSHCRGKQENLIPLMITILSSYIRSLFHVPIAVNCRKEGARRIILLFYNHALHPLASFCPRSLLRSALRDGHSSCIRWRSITRNWLRTRLQMSSRKQWSLLAIHKGAKGEIKATGGRPGDGKKLHLVIRGSTKSLLFLLLVSLGIRCKWVRQTAVSQFSSGRKKDNSRV